MDSLPIHGTFPGLRKSEQKDCLFLKVLIFTNMQLLYVLLVDFISLHVLNNSRYPRLFFSLQQSKQNDNYEEIESGYDISILSSQFWKQGMSYQTYDHTRSYISSPATVDMWLTSAFVERGAQTKFGQFRICIWAH